MKKLFGTDGIRGTVGNFPLEPEFVMRLGQAAGVVLSHNKKKPVFLIGRDTRESGEMLQSALTAGLLASGADVLDVGVMTTPGVSWLTRRLGMTSGIVISASHNPLAQNGIKFFNAYGEKLSAEEESIIETMVLAIDESIRIAENLGRNIQGDCYKEEYIASLTKEQTELDLSPYKIILDCANGAASAIAPQVFNALGAQVITVNSTPSGKNINFNSGSEYVRRYNEKVGTLLSHFQADFAIAFDGDADRVVFTDENGNLIDGDAIIGLLANYFDQHQKLLEQKVVVTIMRNLGLKNYLCSKNIDVIETPVGDKYIFSELQSIKSRKPTSMAYGLGGEQSGHVIILDDEHSTGDGIRTALFVLRAFSEANKERLSSFVTDLGRTPQIIASAYVGHGEHLSKDELEELLQQTMSNTKGLAEGNLRYSGTEPLFRAMFQSDGSILEKDLGSLAVNLCRKVQKRAQSEGAEIDVLNCTQGGVIHIV